MALTSQLNAAFANHKKKNTQLRADSSSDESDSDTSSSSDESSSD